MIWSMSLAVCFSNFYKIHFLYLSSLFYYILQMSLFRVWEGPIFEMLEIEIRSKVTQKLIFQKVMKLKVPDIKS